MLEITIIDFAEGEHLVSTQKAIRKGSWYGLTEDHCRFLSQQVLCFLCTVNREGCCAVNYRGGMPGFLVPFLPNEVAPGGILLLSDYAGNGAFEALGNILETKQAALVVPNYVAQMALCVSGEAHVMEAKYLVGNAAHRCRGAERVVALVVQNIEVQSGDWSELLEYESADISSVETVKLPSVCALAQHRCSVPNIT